jgi:hypothetical protein
MSEAAPDADHARELDQLADELYALRPDAFAAARDEQVRKARTEGRPPLARELGRLRRPTQSAWLINLLWRNQREVMEQLLQLGEDLSRAQAQASGPELHRLTALRRQLEAALVRGARTLAEKDGVTVSAAMEREAQETLAAALARPDVADEIRTGRLVKPATYAGFGTLLPAMPPVAAPPNAAVDSEPRQLHASRVAPPADDREARAAERAREQRQIAERAVHEARAALAVAAETLADHGREADAALQHRQAVQHQVDQIQAQLRALQDQLREIQKQVTAAEQAAVAAAGRRDEAEKAHAAALRTLAHAQHK